MQENTSAAEGFAPKRPSYHGKPLLQRIRLDRPLSDYTRVRSLIGNLVRNRVVFGKRDVEYLNAGCGKNLNRAFFNLDYYWRRGLDACWDLARPLPLRTGSFRGVYSEHCLEHMSLPDCKKALAEFCRILRPGGIARIVVPDAEQYIRTYISLREGGNASFPYMQNPPADWTPLQEVNRLFRGYGHQYAYDFETMALLLKAAGFKEVHRCGYREGRDPQLLIDSESRRSESVYLEAIR